MILLMVKQIKFEIISIIQNAFPRKISTKTILYTIKSYTYPQVF